MTRQVIRQIEAFLEDGDRAHLTVALALLDENVVVDAPAPVDSAELGQWDVDVNGDDTGVVLGFTHFAQSGIESFSTGLPREQALSLATAILNEAVRLPAEGHL